MLLREIRAARHSVHFETFLWQKGALGARVADALSEAARAGRKVRVLLDAVGARKLGRDVRKQMEEAGCSVVFFHRKGFHNIGVLNDRDHRKIAIIDDEVFPPLEHAGDVLIHAAFVKPEGSAPAVKILHHVAICLARKRIWIQNPYFIPEPETIDAFKDAVSRGVDVRVILPSTQASDNPLVQHASHRNFEKLLKRGVRLFEYPDTLLHQKVMTIDGVWSALGSSNIDDRSFETNDEITLGICDIATAQQRDAIFERYVRKCKEIDLETWHKRGPWRLLSPERSPLILKTGNWRRSQYKH